MKRKQTRRYGGLTTPSVRQPPGLLSLCRRRRCRDVVRAGRRGRSSPHALPRPRRSRRLPRAFARSGPGPDSGQGSRSSRRAERGDVSATTPARNCARPTSPPPPTRAAPDPSEELLRASALEAAGDADGACRALKHARWACSRALGQDHPETRSATRLLAALEERRGRYEAALDLYTEVHAGEARAHGERSEAAAAALSAVAACLEGAGRSDDARRAHEAVLRMDCAGAWSGPRGRAALASLHAVGNCHLGAGRFRVALGIFREVASREAEARRRGERAPPGRPDGGGGRDAWVPPGFDRALLPLDADLAATLGNQAVCMAALGDHAGALGLYGLVLASHEATAGEDPEGPGTGLGGDPGPTRWGDPEAGALMAAARDAEGGREGNGGAPGRGGARRPSATGSVASTRDPSPERGGAGAPPRGPGAARSTATAARLVRQRAAADAARAGDARAAARLAGHLGAAQTRANVAAVHLARGELGSARALLTSALAAQEACLGRGHPVAASTLDALALCKCLGGAEADARGAALMLDEAVSALRSALGEGHPDAARALGNRAMAAAAAGDPAGAAGLFADALGALTAALGPGHPDAETLRGNLQRAVASARARGQSPPATRPGPPPGAGRVGWGGGEWAAGSPASRSLAGSPTRGAAPALPPFRLAA